MVTEGYITDGPGYHGKVLVMVCSGGPDLTFAYGWKDGKIFEFTRS